MVHTRSSTGNLPPPKLKSLMEEDSGLEEDYDDGMENELNSEDLPASQKNNDTDEEDEDFDSGEEQSELGDVNFKEAIRVAKKLQKPDGKHLTRFQRALAGSARSTKWKNMTDKVSYYRQSKISKRNAGKLAGLMDAPLDVFVEVACYLDPLDLLHLSRVSLQMRGILMSRQARTIWKAARTAIGMPDCPNDLDEPLYANLIFEKHCNVCGTPRIQKANYVLRLRFCAGCITANIIRGTTIVKEINRKLLKDKDIYTLIPNQRDGLRRWGGSGTSSQQYFFKPDFVDVIIKYLSSTKDSEGRKNFVIAQQKRKEKMIEEGQAIESWVARYELNKSQAVYGITRTRKENIIEKLRDSQWTDGDIDLLERSIEFESFANQPRELTERIWKSIFPKMQDLLPELRKKKEQRLEEERKRNEEWKRREKERIEAEEIKRVERRARAEKHQAEAQTRREQQSKETEALAKKAVRVNNLVSNLSGIYHQYVIGQSANNNLLLVPNIADILDYVPPTLLKTLDDQQLSGTEMFNILLPHIPTAADKHKKNILNRCSQLLFSSRGSVKLPDYYKQELVSTGRDISVVLQFAWAFFQCNLQQCSHLSHYPDIIGHSHFKGNVEPNSNPSKPLPSFRFLRDNMRCPIMVMQNACKLLISLNLSLSTRISEMRAMGRTFVCLRCSGSSDVKMTWEDLVGHFTLKAKEVMKESGNLQNTTNNHFSESSHPLAARLA